MLISIVSNLISSLLSLKKLQIILSKFVIYEYFKDLIYTLAEQLYMRKNNFNVLNENLTLALKYCNLK